MEHVTTPEIGHRDTLKPSPTNILFYSSRVFVQQLHFAPFIHYSHYILYSHSFLIQIPPQLLRHPEVNLLHRYFGVASLNTSPQSDSRSLLNIPIPVTPSCGRHLSKVLF